MFTINRLPICVSAAALTLALAGCQTANHTQAGALVGSGLGALAGAVVGSESGHAEGGAVVGALAGAALGSAVGAEEDAREQRQAIAQARYNEQVRNGVSNADLVMMTRNGLSDDVILSTIRSKGGNFDLSPSAVIALKNDGVSDTVILGAQLASRSSSPEHFTIIHEEYAPPPNVSFGVLVGPRPVCRPRSHVHWGYHMHSW